MCLGCTGVSTCHADWLPGGMWQSVGAHVTGPLFRDLSSMFVSTSGAVALHVELSGVCHASVACKHKAGASFLIKALF